MIGAPNVVEIVKPIYVEDFGKIKQLEEKLEKEKIEMKQQVEHEIKKVLRQKNLAEDEKHRLVEELKKQEKEKRKAKTNQQRLLKKLKEMEEKLCMGSQMMEQAVRQEQELQKARQEVDAQRRQERELERKLKEKEEVFNMLEQRYSSQQEEVEEKNKKLTKLWKKYQECSNEIRDLHTEFQKEREAMVDTIRVLTEAIKLKTLIVDNFVPKEESTRIERRAVWNEELEEWELPSLDPSKPTSKGKRPGSAVGLARPTSEYARIAWGLGDGNTRFRHTDIITLDLDLPERTTEEYDGNIPIVIQDLIQKILNEIDDDSIYMPIESSSAQPPMRPKTGKRPSTASRKGKRPESGAKRSKPQ
jgi:kinesin family protein 3/17